MTGYPPRETSFLLRLEGVVALIAAIAAYQALGGDWWIFALLILAPDLSMLGMLAGKTTGTRIYNLAHTYSVPMAIGGIGWLSGAMSVFPFALIWAAHIALDRALGYGLKYPGKFDATHLGPMGKAKKDAKLANPG